MAYDEDLAHRLRELLADEDAITEKRMFGGLAFLLHGNMAVSASRPGRAAGPHRSGRHRRGARAPARRADGDGQAPMAGWIRVAPEGLKTKRDLAAWVKRSVAYAKTLPPK